METQAKPNTTGAYVYTPLSSNKNEIRLLRLLPKSSSPTIEIEIFHVETTTKPYYEALSYVWGSSERCHSVYVKELLIESDSDPLSKNLFCKESTSHLGITQALWIALLHLRLPGKARILWIDSICINQADIDERSREVRKMGDIFHQARRVVVWLGEETPENSLAIPTLNSIGGGIEISLNASNALLWWMKPGSEALYLETSPQAEKAKGLNWIAIRNLLGATWFTRLWTFQEIGLAVDARFLIGTQTIEVEIFRAALIWILDQRDDKSQRTIPKFLDSKVTNVVKPFLQQRYQKDFDTVASLSAFTSTVRRLDCLDPRDCVYAILSLLEKEYHKALIPDYTKTVEEVFVEAILLEIKISSKLSLLRHCDFTKDQSTLKLPSWVLDLSRPGSTEVLNQSFPAGLARQESEYLEASTVLRVRGKLPCTINHVGKPIPLAATVQEILTICLTWEPPNASQEPYIKGGTLIDTFIATLFIGGTSVYSRIEKPELFKKEALRNAYDSLIINKSISSDTTIFLSDFETYLPGRTFFNTEEGFMGLCSASVRPGDQILIALGCGNPIVLRKDSQREDYFQVGGECYVHGLSNGVGLLGPLPSGWSVERVIFRGHVRTVFTSPEGKKTQYDPRAGPLPLGWSVCYGVEGEWNTDELGEIGNLRELRFYNESSEEETELDPRLTSENLKTLGISLEDVYLV